MGALRPRTPPSGKILTPQVLAYTYIGLNVKFQVRSSINVRLTESSMGFALKGPPKWGFGLILGIGQKYLVGKYIRPQNCAFSDIFGPDLTRRMGIAICHRRKFGKVWGSQAPLPCRRKTPLPEGTPWTFDYHMEKS